MSKFTVTVLDTKGIQPYIFGSNRLRENIGGSYLVKQATENWVEDSLKELRDSKNFSVKIHIPDYKRPESKPHIEDGELATEIIYAGGGNTILLFQTSEFAIEFTKILSKKILKKAPGINLVVAHNHDFDWNNDSLYETVQNLMKYELEQKKQARIPSSPLLGLGVTADCLSTRLVAVDTSDKHGAPTSYPISREIVAKLDSVDAANEDIKKYIFDPKKPNVYKIPKDFDGFSRSEGEMSYLAVVHADGNSMGKRFQKFGKDKPNRDYITAMRQLSYSVKQAGMQALKATTEILINSIVEVTENGEKIQTIKEQFKLKEKNLLPFRPLVYGGDDVTFVCDGRLGLELAASYLQEFEKQLVADGKLLRACAGVCIVKVHYPFARAYETSESLCKNAKAFVNQQEKKGEQNFSAIDWHISSSGLIGSIAEIRKREYTENPGSLTMRPVRITESHQDWRTWKGSIKVIQDLKNGKDWAGRNNKIKALREVLRQGEVATKSFLHSYQLANLPAFPSSVGDELNLSTDGWINGICGYFDAIEAMEFYLCLKSELNQDELDELSSTAN